MWSFDVVKLYGTCAPCRVKNDALPGMYLGYCECRDCLGELRAWLASDKIGKRAAEVLGALPGVFGIIDANPELFCEWR